MRNSALFLAWTVDELRETEKRSRKFTMKKVFHPKGGVDRLFLGRNYGGRELFSIEDCVKNYVLGLREYVEEGNEMLTRSAKIGMKNLRNLLINLKEEKSSRRKGEMARNTNVWIVCQVKEGYSR